MFKSLLLVGCGICAMTISSRAIDAEKTALQVINSEGELTISDGSSFYTFKKDGEFSSGPYGSISGRTMGGTWRAPGGDSEKAVQFVIDAKMGWMNGMQSRGDFRTITIWVFPVYKETTAGSPSFPIKPSHLYKCYFFIDEMRKKTQRVFGIAVQDRIRTTAQRAASGTRRSNNRQPSARQSSPPFSPW